MASTVIRCDIYRICTEAPNKHPDDVASGAKDLNFSLSLHLHLYFGNASSEGSGESAHLNRLARSSVA